MTVLAAVDYTDHSPPALRMAARFADILQTGLSVVHCQPNDDRNYEWRLGSLSFTDADAPADDERHDFEAFVRRALDNGIPDKPVILYLRRGTPAEAVDALSSELNVQLCVTGSTHRGAVANFLSESTSETLVRRCSLPVVVVPTDPDLRDLDAPILVPVDPQDANRQSFGLAVQLARRTDVPLVILHVKPGSLYGYDTVETSADLLDVSEGRAGRELQQFLLGFDLRGVDYRVVVRPGSPPNVILNTYEAEQCGLIVVGRHSRPRLRELLLGSTTYRLLRHLPCPIIIVPNADERAGSMLPEFAASS